MLTELATDSRSSRTLNSFILACTLAFCSVEEEGPFKDVSGESSLSKQPKQLSTPYVLVFVSFNYLGTCRVVGSF